MMSLKDHAQLVKTLGGGEPGRQRLARIERVARGRPFNERCNECRRLYVTSEFSHLSIWVLTGGGGICSACRLKAARVTGDAAA